MRRLDGEVNRELAGRTISAVAKDGLYMTIYATNGEQWCIGWADFVKGIGFKGEPCVMSVGDARAAAGRQHVRDGHLHKLLAGKRIAGARTDGELLYLEVEGGEEYGIGWVDPATGEQVSAEPCMVRVDVSVTPPGVSAFGAAGEPG